MVIIVLLWLVLVFAGIKYVKTDKDSIAFSRDNSLALRGICSIEIMMGHLGIATNSAVLFPNRKAGILFVGVFFALSGYGLMYSLRNKDDYLDGFPLNRLPKLLIPAYVIYVIGVLLKSPDNLFKVFRPDMFFADTNWYVWELLAMYIVFYVCARLVGASKIHRYIFVISFVFVCIGYVVKLNRPWYGSTFCFWLGIIYFLKMEKFREILVFKHCILSFIVSGFILIISIGLFFVNEDWIIGDLIGRNLASLSFVIIVILCLYRFKMGNLVSLWLGRYSYEIFLFHPVFIAFLRTYIADDMAYATLVIALTIIAAFIYCTLADLIKRKLRGKYSSQLNEK